jgi:hypothetical protein
MRPLSIVAVACSAGAVLTACSSATSSAPAAAPSPAASQSCTVTLQAWLLGPGGSALRSVLTAGVAMGAALESGSEARVTGAAQGLDSAAATAGGHLPPACADHGAAYQTALHDWKMGASDARDGYLSSASSRIASGARAFEVATMLKQLSPTLIGDLARPVAIAVASTAPAVVATSAPAAVATPAPPTTPAAATMAPSTAPAAPPTTAAASPAGCHPLSDEGTCYEPGEYCRDDDHGVSGVAGDGEAIICEDNDGWRWEPASS